MTKTAEQTALGQGLALGAIMASIESVNGNKGNLELDFRRAWRAWPFARLFPSIKAGPTYDDVLHVLRKSNRRRGSIVAEWNGQWPFVPVLIQDWSYEEIAELIQEHVPATAWRDLVLAWLASSPPPRSHLRE